MFHLALLSYLENHYPDHNEIIYKPNVPTDSSEQGAYLLPLLKTLNHHRVEDIAKRRQYSAV